MSLYRGLHILTGIEAGSITSASLQTMLTGAQAAQNKAELAAVLASRGQFRRAMALGLTLTTLTGSAAAMTLIFASKVLLTNFMTAIDSADGADGMAAATYIVTTSPYRDTIAASYELTGVAMTSAHIRRAIWLNDAALSVFAAVSDAVQAMRDSPLFRISSLLYPDANARRIPISSDAIMVGWSVGTSASVINLNSGSRRAGSTVGALSAASGTATGTKAEFNNVVAIINNPAALQPLFNPGTSSRTIYVGYVPAGAPV